LGPTSPVVSGGNTAFTLPIPSTVRDGAGIVGISGDVWTTESGKRPDGCRDTRRHRGSRSFTISPCGGGPGGRSRRRGDRSNRSSVMIDVGEPARVADGAGRWALISVTETSAVRTATANRRFLMREGRASLIPSRCPPAGREPSPNSFRCSGLRFG
jgi:hypothetical protein